MKTQEALQTCDSIVRKLTSGEKLDDTEKAHLADCEDCLLRVIEALDATRPARGPDSATARPEAVQALEHGRRVFEREFGISLGKKN